jgi:hypothetical protein
MRPDEPPAAAACWFVVACRNWVLEIGLRAARVAALVAARDAIIFADKMKLLGNQLTNTQSVG